jgi:hypothetical protein
VNEEQNTIRPIASNVGDLLVVHRSNAIVFFARSRVSCLELVLDLHISCESISTRLPAILCSLPSYVLHVTKPLHKVRFRGRSIMKLQIFDFVRSS